MVEGLGSVGQYGGVWGLCSDVYVGVVWWSVGVVKRSVGVK